MKTSIDIPQELRERILSLPGVTEKQDAGIHEDAFFVGSTMFMHIHGRGHCDIRLSKADQARVLADGKARPHRWAPKSGYVTSIVKREEDLERGSGLGCKNSQDPLEAGALVQAGLSESFARLHVEMTRAFNEETIKLDRARDNTTPTRFEDFAD